MPLMMVQLDGGPVTVLLVSDSSISSVSQHVTKDGQLGRSKKKTAQLGPGATDPSRAAPPMVNLFVIPQSKLITVHLAYTHPLGGHLGPQNTLENIFDWFQWPAHFPPHTQTHAASATIDHWGMVLVGLLPKSAPGHEYILMVMDYATRFPEAGLLHKATLQKIAKEHSLSPGSFRISDGC